MTVRHVYLLFLLQRRSNLRYGGPNLIRLQSCRFKYEFSTINESEIQYTSIVVVLAVSTLTATRGHGSLGGLLLLHGLVFGET